MNIAQINAAQLRPLPPPAKALARPRLIRRLAEADAQAGRLVLLCAPLGYGKSCLLSQYAHSLSSPWSWLRLTQADNQPLNLLLHLPQERKRDQSLFWRGAGTVDRGGKQSFSDGLAWTSPDNFEEEAGVKP